jgi:hypothetical protein
VVAAMQHRGPPADSETRSPSRPPMSTVIRFRFIGRVSDQAAPHREAMRLRRLSDLDDRDNVKIMRAPDGAPFSLPLR